MGTSSSCLKVEERQPSYYSLALVIDRHERGDESLRLYRAGARTYEAVLANKTCSPMCYSLFRLEDEAVAREKFRYLYERLSPFYQTSKRCYNSEILQSLMDTLEDNPDWSLAHVATQVGLTECLEDNAMVQSLDSKQHDKQWTPLHLAAKIGKTEVVRKLLEFDPKLLVADTLGNTPLHYAAQVSPDILLAMVKKTVTSPGGEQQVKEIVNAKNGKGESPLHVACQYSQEKGVKVLLESGAEVDAKGYEYPIHTAIKSNSVQCAATVLEFHPEQLEIRDMKHGGAPLHWVRSRECIELLLERGADLEVVNNEGETPLHIMVRCGRLECIISLLSQGANINAKGKKGSTPLHLAVEYDNLDVVHALIVFGADINALNSSHQTPRHIASAGIKLRGKDIARALCLVGAVPCDLKRIRCTTECGRPFTEEFKVGGPPSSSLHTVFPSYEEALGLLALAASWHKGRGMDRVDYGGPIREEMSIFKSICGKDAVLSMDGGGIRGLILIQLLLAVEDVTGQPTAQLFDWIGGTSTGGILALAIAHGKSVRYCQGLYFNMKNRVFKGMRPYDSDPLEGFLRKEFGESTIMSSIVHPKVAVTGILADRRPAVLHLFRTYDNPAADFVNPSYKAPPKPADQKIWRAARGTGAAPTYFRAMGRILDGGLIANNPTLDLLTEIHNYNRFLREQGRRPRDLGLVLSLGTGVPPEENVKSVDVFKPEGIMDTAMAAMGARSLGNLLVDQVTASNGAVVERAKAWCEMIQVPFFRFTTPMSSDVGLDETDDKVLVKMLWEAQAYIYQHRNEFERLGMLLTEAS